MDFASILSSEISKKRKTAPTTSTTTSEKEAASKKYLKRSEIEAQREAAYKAEQAALESERQQKAAAKRAEAAAESARRDALKQKQQRLGEEAKRRENERRGIKPETEAEGGAGEEGDREPEMTDEEAIKRLRGFGMPARLFGETPPARLRRLKRIEARATPPPADSDPSPSLSESEMLLAPHSGTSSRPPSEAVYKQLDAWFRLVMREWKLALDQRPVAVKESIQGRKAADAMKQADEYMKPLFAHFKKGDLREQVFEKVCEIVGEAQKRRYVKANDVYLRLSIGNAAWPIGVTMVGIHERSAREKLHEHGREGAAHIMSDEVTRKFLQSIKRCLSFCQTRWPPEDPLQLMG